MKQHTVNAGKCRELHIWEEQHNTTQHIKRNTREIQQSRANTHIITTHLGKQ
jgi:hypothetical protein